MQVVVWYNEKKNDYYYKLIHDFSYKNYHTGYKNGYNHEIILIIRDIYLKKPKIKFKKRVITKIISFLQRINK